MVPTFLVVLREAFEAALLLGIVYTYLDKIDRPQHARYVTWGAGLGLVASVGAGLALSYASGALLDLGPDLVATVVLLVSVCVLTGMTLWMRRHARAIRGDVQRRIDAAEASQRLWLIGLVAFTGVFREGAETVLFLWGLLAQATAGAGWSSLAGGLLGLAAAIVIASAIFHGSKRVSLPKFFAATSILLLLVAAGLFTTAVGRLQGLGVLPLTGEVWDTSAFISDRSLLGWFFSGLLGYRARPTFPELAAYVAYLLAASLVLFADRLPWRRSEPRLAEAPRRG